MNIGPNGQLLQGGFPDEESEAKSYRQGLLSRTSRLGVEPDPGCINRDLIIKHPTNGLSSERSRSKVYKRVSKTEQSMSPLIEFAFWCAFWVLISGPLVEHRSCLLIPTVQSNSSHSGGHLEMAWQRVNIRSPNKRVQWTQILQISLLGWYRREIILGNFWILYFHRVINRVTIFEMKNNLKLKNKKYSKIWYKWFEYWRRKNESKGTLVER